MATFTEQAHPYEFLVRWGKDGAIAGAHVGMRTLTYRDGVEIADKPEAVVLVSIGAASGYPLAEILTEIQLGAIAAMDKAVAEKDALAATLEQVTNERDALLKANL